MLRKHTVATNHSATPFNALLSLLPSKRHLDILVCHLLKVYIFLFFVKSSFFLYFIDADFDMIFGYGPDRCMFGLHCRLPCVNENEAEKMHSA